MGLTSLKHQIEKKAIDLGDELRDNLALDSIAKAQIIETLKELESFVLGLLANYEKTELQRKAKTVFKIRKMIDDWEKEHCLKCQGLLNCKLCLECEIGMRKGAYKNVLKLLEKNDVTDCVCIPRKQLEELIKNRPHFDGIQYKSLVDWFEKLEKLLEESK